MSDWQPIETAVIKPFCADDWYRQATPSLLLSNGWRATVGYYSYTSKGKGRWVSHGQIFVPTHWMEIPKLPEAGK
jgi:hypothetical protein